MPNEEKRLQYSAEEINDKLADVTESKGSTASLAARLNGIDSTISEKASVTTANSLQNQIDEIARSAGTGTADTEIAQARVDGDGTVYDTLKNRLDASDAELKNAIDEIAHHNRYDVIKKNALRTDATADGITYAWSGDTCKITGTATKNTFNNVFNSNLNVSELEAGKTYYLLFNDDVASNVYIRMYFSTNGTTFDTNQDFKKSGYFTVPSNVVKMTIRFQIDSGSVVDCNTFCYVLNASPIENFADSQTVQLPSGDLNALRGNKVWLLTDNRNYTNLPTDKTHKAGYLFTYHVANWFLQLFIPFTFTGLYRRASNGGSTWQAWTQIADGGGDTYNYTNEYNLTSYQNEYDVTAVPTITTDTNNYLSATGDNTDVTNDIISLLETTGVCHLGPGDFYVSGVDMPDDSMLYGCGPTTRVILLGNNTDTGYAIQINNRCSVKDMSILGNTTDISYANVSKNIVERHGILFEALYSVDSSFKERSNIENVWIKNFTGGGITCYNTGYGTASCINVVNAYIYQCNAGVYIPFFSEFHRFTNVHAHNCYYGAVNNGGNCSFVNCGFSANRIGMLMDNSTGQSTNNSHGTVSECIFDHADGNTGLGIKIDGMRNGEIFSNCQLFYAGISVNNSSGIQFNNFNCGGSNVDITVTKGASGGLVTFNNFVFADNSYSISIESGYTLCKFDNCWTRGGTAVTG